MFSIWEQRTFHAEADLVIIGAGITGLFAALHYQRREPGHRVLVLERGPYPSGASVKNAGFACFGSPSEILADMDAEGPLAAAARVHERWLGLRELREALGDGNIGYEPSGGHELFGKGDALYNRVAERFDELNDLLAPIFGRPPYEWRNTALGDLGLRTGHIAFTPLEGAVDSGALMRSLMAKAVAAGVELRFGQHAVEVVTDGDRARVRLTDGTDLTAGHALVATNGYTAQLFPDISIKPARGQVVLTSPIPGLRLRGTFHMDEGYYYFRDYQGRVLLGGGRHLDKTGETTTEDNMTPLIQGALEHLLREVILPDQPFTIEHRWSGVMGFRTHGKTPLVERISPRVIVAAGLSGMGVAIGTRVAKQAVDLLA